ncbi:MAG: nuclear transport factor 2 family protein [Ktedonobacteraceae bacterium]|jgi:hypothetical protein
MSSVDIAKDFMIALESKDYDTAASYLSDDFVFSGWTPQPLDKDQFITVMGELKAGIPNLSYHFHTVRDVRDLVQESNVKAAIQMTGTQTDSFILPPLGLPPIPQMARSVSLPEEHWDYTLQNGKIVKITVQRVPGGGIQGLLHQLGIDMPIIQ